MILLNNGCPAFFPKHARPGENGAPHRLAHVLLQCTPMMRDLVIF